MCVNSQDNNRGDYDGGGYYRGGHCLGGHYRPSSCGNFLKFCNGALSLAQSSNQKIPPLYPYDSLNVRGDHTIVLLPIDDSLVSYCISVTTRAVLLFIDGNVAVSIRLRSHIMEILVIAIATIFLLWVTGALKTVRRLLNLADTSLIETASMAEQELKRLSHAHQASVLKSVAKQTVSDEEFEQAKANLEKLKSFRL